MNPHEQFSSAPLTTKIGPSFVSICATACRLGTAVALHVERELTLQRVVQQRILGFLDAFAYGNPICRGGDGNCLLERRSLKLRGRRSPALCSQICALHTKTYLLPRALNPASVQICTIRHGDLAVPVLLQTSGRGDGDVVSNMLQRLTLGNAEICDIGKCPEL